MHLSKQSVCLHVPGSVYFHRMKAWWRPLSNDLVYQEPYVSPYLEADTAAHFSCTNLLVARTRRLEAEQYQAGRT